jgi:hypothetical protein
MKYSTVFHLISAICEKTGIACVLIGGFAVNYYKYTRQTVDVDFLITNEDFEKILHLLKKAGYKQDYTQKFFTRFKSNKLHLMDIDFMFVDKETLGKIISTGKKIDIAERKFIVPSLFNLIALKLHSIKYNPGLRRSTDLPDILNLIRINKVDFKSGDFKNLCLKYGTGEIYDEISRSI